MRADWTATHTRVQSRVGEVVASGASATPAGRDSQGLKLSAGQLAWRRTRGWLARKASPPVPRELAWGLSRSIAPIHVPN